MSEETVVHPTALVEPGAKLGQGVRIGPFCHVGADVSLGDRVELASHVSVTGATTIGEGTRVFPHAALGGLPQNIKHKGGRTTLEIGRNCVIRESVTMNAGTDGSLGRTTVGNNGYFMAYAHVAHDCVVGNNVTMANSTALAGHCEIGDFVTIGGLTGVHQFARIGHHAFLAGMSAVLGDVIPYGMVQGTKPRLRGLNVIGMRRSGIEKAEIRTLRLAYKALFDRSRPLAENVAMVRQRFPDSAIVNDVVDFIGSRGKRYLILPALDDDGAGDDDGDA